MRRKVVRVEQIQNADKFFNLNLINQHSHYVSLVTLVMFKLMQNLQVTPQSLDGHCSPSDNTTLIIIKLYWRHDVICQQNGGLLVANSYRHLY